MIVVDNDPLGLFGAPSEVTPIESLPPQGGREHRKEIRYKASWRVAVAVEGQDMHDGRIKDISPHGAAILIGCNPKPNTKVTLHIYIPSLTGPGAPKVLVVRSLAAYSVHDANNQCFRIGIAFIKFELVSDRTYLEERLTNHHSKVL
jgi:hypothetical protein